jgi:succinate dehydrogenase / fumarate reductase iron-sulfur subunit
VCPESITITDNAIIPLKERVADQHYDPLRKLVRLMRGKKSERQPNQGSSAGGAR